MTHTFDTEMAKEVGIEAAIIYQNICFWVDKNKANKQNFINGYFWTYNTYKAWQELFPYMKLNTIKRAIKVLKEAGFIVVEKGLNESNKWDKTNYYRYTNKTITDSKEKSQSEQHENNDEYNTDNKQQTINTVESQEGISLSQSEIDSRDVALYLLGKINNNKPNFKQPNLNTWISDIDKAIRIDKRTRNELIGCIDWIYTTKEGNFWIPNILSGKKLREKFDTMEAQMMRSDTNMQSQKAIDEFVNGGDEW